MNSPFPNHLPSSAPRADPHEADSAARRSLESAQQRVASGSLWQRLLAGQDEARVIKHLNDRADQVAKETAIAKIKALTEFRKLDIDLDCERRKAEIRKQTTAQAAELSRQSAAAMSSTMDGYIELRTAWQQLADRTKCSDTDRDLLLGLSLELARLRLQEVATQHGMDEGLFYGFAPREFAAGRLVIADNRNPPGKQFDNCCGPESVGIRVNLLATERNSVLPNRNCSWANASQSQDAVAVTAIGPCWFAICSLSKGRFGQQFGCTNSTLFGSLLGTSFIQGERKRGRPCP